MVGEGKLRQKASRHCGGGRNPGRSIAGCWGGSSDTMGPCSERSVVMAGLVLGLGFLDCGLRRNDGGGTEHCRMPGWFQRHDGALEQGER